MYSTLKLQLDKLLANTNKCCCQETLILCLHFHLFIARAAPHLSANQCKFLCNYIVNWICELIYWKKHLSGKKVSFELCLTKIIFSLYLPLKVPPSIHTLRMACSFGSLAGFNKYIHNTIIKDTTSPNNLLPQASLHYPCPQQYCNCFHRTNPLNTLFHFQ